MGIDIGTSSAKVIIIDEHGETVAEASSKYPILTPTPRWAEQDPESWWFAVKEAVRKTLTDSKVVPNRISAIGLSGQMHGTVLLDAELRPVRPAIIWADKRSQSQCAEIYEKVGKERVLGIVCNPVMPGFMAPSLLWVKQNEPSIFRSVHVVLLPKDYIRLRLTGSLATDVSDASATLLFDIMKRKWSDEIISNLGFQTELFPEICESVEVTGEICKEASEETSLPKGTKVVAGGGDSPVGAVGCGVMKPGIVSSNIGSAGQVFAVLDEMRVDPKFRIHTFCHAVSDKWCIQGAILSAGLSLSWFAGTLRSEQSRSNDYVDPYERLSREAESAEPGCNGLLFLPYLIGERSPHMDPSARGLFFGLTLSHKRAHMIRAVMEGVIYALRDSLEVFKELGVKVDRVIARGGGARSALWRQIQADVFNSQVMTAKVKEEAAFGAALLGGVGAGFYRDLEEAVKQTVGIRSVEYPNADRAKIYEHYYRNVYRRLYPSLRRYFRLL